MAFGFNNFNMMNMFPMMNFGSFGFGSFGCGNGYGNFGSLFGCGFGSNYLNPTNCDGSTNWGSVGYGLFSTFSPVLFAGVTRLVSGAVQNSNGNQQEVVAGDVETLQSKIDDALAALGSGVTESNYKDYTIDDKEESYKLDKENAATNLKNANNRIAVLDGSGDGSISKLKAELEILNAAEPKNDSAIAAKEKEIADAELELRELKAKVASPNGELYKADAVATKAYNDRAEAIRLQKIAIEEAIKQRDNAQADLLELRLDDYDGLASQRTSKENFEKRLKIGANTSATGAAKYLVGNTKVADITKGDVRYIINQYRTSTGETQKEYGEMLKAIWNDLDPDIKKSNDCRGGYQVICADLKRKAEAEAKS